MEHSTFYEALLSGFFNGTLAAGLIWLLFKPGKLEWLWPACFVVTFIFTFFFGPSLPNPFKM